MKFPVSRIAFVIAPAVLMAMPGIAHACEVRRVLTGVGETSTVVHRGQFGTYNSYPVRTRAKAGSRSRGVIRYELVPMKWGFDLRLPGDKILATVNRETVDDGGPGYTRWTVNPMPDYDAACRGQEFELRAGKAGEAIILSKGRIGSIARFPFQEVF